jgi:hypothetical protein
MTSKIVHCVYVKGEITNIYVGVVVCTREGYALYGGKVRFVRFIPKTFCLSLDERVFVGQMDKISTVLCEVSTRSPFVTLLSRRAQSGRRSSFGKRVWFTESHLVLIISFLLVLFTHFIFDKMNKSRAVSS